MKLHSWIYLLLIIAFTALMPARSYTQDIEHPIRMPAGFHHGLIFVEPVSQEGDTLRFFTDTADATLLYRHTVDRLGLTTTSTIIQDQQQLAAFLPLLDSTRFIPPPLLSDGLIPVRPDDRMPPHHRVILGDENGIQQPGDGILGSTWFASRAWSINFRDETFYVKPTSNYRPASSENPTSTENSASAENTASSEKATSSVQGSLGVDDKSNHSDSAVSLSFYEEGDRRLYHFPRLEVIIAGDTLSMVLKTGSNVILDESAQASLNHPDPLFPAGLISESVAANWVDIHPDWPVYENADSNYGSDLIEVPEVQIGPHTAGPVRFAIRRDEAFIDWFSQFTDKPVVGALGADAFRGAHITLNYPWSVLIFHD